MALVAHLRGHLVFLFRRHHQLDLPEAVAHGFFAIDVLAEGHRQHRDGEMGEIRRADAYGVNVLAHLVEHLPEILKARRVRDQLQCFLRVRRAHVRVAQRDEIHHAGLVKHRDVLRAAITDADAGEIDFVVGARRHQQVRSKQGCGTRSEHAF